MWTIEQLQYNIEKRGANNTKINITEQYVVTLTGTFNSSKKKFKVEQTGKTKDAAIENAYRHFMKLADRYEPKPYRSYGRSLVVDNGW